MNRAFWPLSSLLAIGFVLALCGPLPGADPPAARTDSLGDPLPPGAIARIGSVRFRHFHEVGSLGYCDDGKVLLTATSEEPIRLWEAASGKPLGTLPFRAVHDGNLPLSRDGKRLAVRASPGVHVIAVPSGKVLWTLTWGKRAVHDIAVLALSPEGRTLAVVFRNDNKIYLYDVEAGKRRHVLQSHTDEVISLAFSPDGKWLASGDVDGKEWDNVDDDKKPLHDVRLWEVGTGRLVHRLPGHRAGVTCLAFTPDSKTLIVGGYVSKLRFWDVAGGKLRRDWEGGGGRFLVLSPDGKVRAQPGSDGIHLLEVATGKDLRTLGTGKDRLDYPLAFSPDGKTLAASSRPANRVCLLDVGTGEELPQSAANRPLLASCALSPSGETVASVPNPIGDDLWRPPTWEAVPKGSGRDQVWLWEAATGKPLRRLEGVGHPLFRVAFSPDGKTVAAVGPWVGKCPWKSLGPVPDLGIYLWDVASGRLIKALGQRERGFEVHRFGFLPGGIRLALECDDGLCLWSITEDKRVPLPLRDLPPRTKATGWAASADGRLLAVRLRHQRLLPREFVKSIHLVDLRADRLLGVIAREHWHPSALALSCDGKVLAWGEAKGKIHLWDTRAQKELRRIALPEPPFFGIPSALAFSPDGRFLATGSGANLNGDPPQAPLQLWEVSTGRRVLSLWGHFGAPIQLQFARGGRRLFSFGTDRTALVWDLLDPPGMTPPPPGGLPPARLAQLWDDLGEADAAVAYRAICQLGRSPRQAVPLLDEHLTPAPARDNRRIRELIAALDSSGFAERQRAQKELKALGRRAEPELQEALRRGSPETRRRARELLAALPAGRYTREEVRVMRAAHVLELIGSKAARRSLERLASGGPTALRTRHAREALLRLKRRLPAP
jgi:WD40 repeat protein